MKGRNSSVPLFIFTPAFIGVLLGLTLAGTSALQAAGGMVATVTAVEGQAEVVAKDSKTPVPVRLEMRVLPGSTVRTKANGRVELQFTDRSLLRLDQNTEITILESEQECGVLVTLGKLWAKVQTVVGASKFQIKTPTIVAGVRGTILRT
ncbi:MAG: FecR family protein, partial [Candidatus Zipacnadales bacterium]